MPWLNDIDIALFRAINHGLVHPFLDGLMPLLSGRSLLPIGVAAVAALTLKMGRRGLAAVLCLAIAISLGESLVISPLKDWLARPRPFLTLPDVRLLVGRGGSGSMPSAHAANWFCVTTVLALFWRPTLALTLPLALLVALSRVYTGVHYPSDILVGGLLGAGYGAAGVFLLERTWIRITRRSFPKLHAWLPQFLPRPTAEDQGSTVNDEWSEVGVPATELIRRREQLARGAPTGLAQVSPPSNSDPSAKKSPPQQSD
jgi:undecaprenyl-diphosphatase